MCGIAGYSGTKDAKTCLLKCLSTLEYRGYDSCGVAFFKEDGKVNVVKNVGRVEALREKLDNETSISHCGIGHTRWATHGGVTSTNAHPHQVGLTTMIHNGIIENYHKLIDEYNIKDKLASETDTEVACFVLNTIYENNGYDPLKAIKELAIKVDGTYAFLIMFSDRPGEIYATRQVSPLVCAKTKDEAIFTSDITAIIEYTKEYSVIPEECIVSIKGNVLKAYDIKTLKEITLKTDTIDWDVDAAMKNGYPHFMLKEINEEPDSVEKTISPRIDGDKIDLSGDNINIKDFENINRIHLVACGTALHSGRVAAYAWEKYLGIPVSCYIASEYRYITPIIDDKTLVIVITQSGETVDTLASLQVAKENKAKTLAIVNVKGSSIARNADYVLYTHSGPEVAVASTKAYIAMIAMLYVFFAALSEYRGNISAKDVKDFISDMKKIPNDIKDTLKLEPEIKKIAKDISYSDHCFYIGRGLDYISALEGALKLKEISYIHTEAYAAGELKHGTIALITDDVPVIAIDTVDDISDKTLSNVREVKARGAKVILIISDNLKYDKSAVDNVITIKSSYVLTRVFLVSIVIQLLAYHVSVIKGLDVDKPRNLAKSVTVE